MEYVELNNKNKKLMKNEMKNDLKFEWEDTDLIKEIIREFDNLYPYSSDPQEFIDDKYYLTEINKYFNLLFKRKIDKELFLVKLEKILNELTEKYTSLSYQYRYNINMYKNIISKSNRLIIKGCGGIGKSYFIYKLEEKLSECGLDHICIYGKYNKTISDKVFEEIKSKKNDFYFIIDAINEFSEEEQQKVLDKINELVKNKNINIIVTYRTFTLKEDIIKKLNYLLINEYEFKGVEFESSLLRLIETYGIDSVRFIDVIESNNPHYLKMLNKILFDSKLKNEEIGSIVQITFIMEKYIKDVCGLDNWKIIKELGKFMFENEITSISELEVKRIVGSKYDDFIRSMTQNNIMSSYEFEKKLNFVFSIQKLSDFIIARPLFSMIKDKSEDEIILLINNKLNKMYTLHNAFALVLLDKYKENDIKKAIRIIFNSDISKELDIQVFKKISFNSEQIKVIQSSIKYEDNKNLFWQLAGHPNRPFNCKNYLNKILFDNELLQKDLLAKFRESDYILHLKNIVYTLPFLNSEMDILEEYLYYSFWLMAVSNERIRNLAIKCVYDICFKKSIFVDCLIDNYPNINELYIKKGIIHVLTKLPKSKKINKFIKSIYYDKQEIDAEIVSRTAIYLNKENEYQLLNKKNLNKIISNEINVDIDMDLKHIIIIADIYEKYLLKFKRYSDGNTLSLYENFIVNDNNQIKQYNDNLLKKFKCIKNDGYCKYSIGNKILKKHIEPIEIIEISPCRMFVLFQETFRELCNKYNYDYSKQERFDIHLNKFENSLLKKLLLLSQDILLGSLMTNYYTSEFSIYNDDKTLGYKNYSYIKYDEEKIYLTSPVSPYNELIDKLNNKICDEIELYENNNYKWYKSKKISIDNCCKLVKPIKYNNENWSLIGGNINLYINDFINVYYSCYMALNPNEVLKGDDNSRYLTIENNKYFGNISDYVNENYCKNVDIPNFDSYSLDIKDTNLSFPPPKLIKLLNLKYNFITSSWNDENDNIIIVCDNNVKKIYNYPVSGAIYMKTEILNKVKENNNVVYWCFTEKLFKDYGWNENASLHLELDSNGNVVKTFNNDNLLNSERKINDKCKKCKFGIYKESNDNLEKFVIKILDDLVDTN